MREKLEMKIREKYFSLRKSEKKVADFLLSFCGEGRELKLEQLADEANVSQPTVLRFIRAIGYRGFKEFRYELAGDNKNEENASNVLYGFHVCEEDTIEELPSKMIATSIEQLKDTLKSLSPKKLEEVIESIINARTIAVYFVENSACIASDLVTKLAYLGFNCCSYSDHYMQAVSANNLTEADVAIGITYSGRSKSTVDAIKTAQKAGAKTIAITNFENSVIHQYADIVLTTSNSQLIYGDAIFSRVSQLAVVDMIYTGIILSDYKKYTNILDKSSKLICNQAYDSIYH